MLFRFHLFKNRLPLFNSALDAYSLRQRTTAKNIANVNSPHYRPERVKFEEFFQQQDVVMRGNRTDGIHIPLGKPGVESLEGEVNPREIPSAEVFFSGETHVNIDKEMAEMAQNQIRFKFGSQMVNRYFKSLTNSITGYTER